ncbi:MAG: DUF488 domain-containing protein [Candidatus Omnitrophota bacterium]|nr:DUF488 domain-containing protein [Candidatus Omnitrophota bacterium]
MTLYTIGFTRKTAQEFFELLIKNGVKLVIDTRLNNKSQLAGFTKEDDLKYFLAKVCNIKYVHMEKWTPTDELLKSYKKKIIGWEEYKNQYLNILEKRDIKKDTDFTMLDNACLLCSEEKAEYCHRRLLAEYFKDCNKDIKIVHL